MNKILRIGTNIQWLIFRRAYNMGMLTDKITQKQAKKAQQQFKKQIQHLANKPSFTYMDYKQRINDQLTKLKSSLKNKMSQQSKQAEKSLQMERRIFNALFQEELNGEKQVSGATRQQIALVSQVSIEKVRESFRKAASYRKMHSFIRDLHLRGEPLPDSMSQLQYEFRNSKFQFEGSQRYFLRQRQQRQRGKNYMRARRLKFIKFYGKQ